MSRVGDMRICQLIERGVRHVDIADTNCPIPRAQPCMLEADSVRAVGTVVSDAKSGES
jgi:hypothetical protein